MKDFTGARVALRLEHKGERPQVADGVVVWQHPQRRFVLIEYEITTIFGTHRMRECQQIVRNRISGAKIIRDTEGGQQC